MTDRPDVRAVLFDLDGVLVSTDRFHYQAWKEMADREGIEFDYQTNHRLRGVSRMQSLEIILEKATRQYTDEQKEAMAASKNDTFQRLIETLTPDDWLPGARELVVGLRQKGILCAVCSSSKNAPRILERLQGTELFETIVDGSMIERTKPDPEIFLLGASRLGLSPEQCVVFEDAESGIEAARAAGMRCIGVGEESTLGKADRVEPDTSHVTVDEVLSL